MEWASEADGAVWKEPARGGMPDPSFYGLPGIEQANAILRRKVPSPPIAHLTGLEMTQVGAGRAIGALPATEWLDNGDETLDVNLGLQEALTMAVLTTAPAAHEVVPLTLTVNHLRPCQLDGRSFVIRAGVIHSGGRFAVAQAVMEDHLGRGVAHATGTHLIRPFDPVPPPFTGFAPFEPPPYQTPDPYLRPLPSPNSFAPALDEGGGLETIRRWAGGELALVVASQHLFGWEFVDVGEGRLTTSLRTNDWFRVSSRPSAVAEGVLAFLGSFTLAGSVLTLRQPGYRAGILEYNLSYLRPAPVDGRELIARAEVSRVSPELFVATADILDANGNLLATGRQTCLSIKRRSRSSGTSPAERVLATVLFTDIVDSTRRAAELGDTAWGDLLAQHHAVTRQQFDTWKGKEIKTTGDGFLATFDSPTRALQCARGITQAVRHLGIEIRVGVHTGECEVSAGDVAGIAVHVAARVMAAAGPAEIFVSGTVRDLVAGSGLTLRDRGRQELKGIEGEWALYSLVD